MQTTGDQQHKPTRDHDPFSPFVDSFAATTQNDSPRIATKASLSGRVLGVLSLLIALPAIAMLVSFSIVFVPQLFAERIDLESLKALAGLLTILIACGLGIAAGSRFFQDRHGDGFRLIGGSLALVVAALSIV